MKKKFVLEINDEKFKEKVLKQEGLILVDFWADWCSPCKILSPILEEIAKDYIKKLTIYKINIDTNPLTGPKYGIRSIPTLILFKDGKPIKTKNGLIPKKEIEEFLHEYIK